MTDYHAVAVDLLRQELSVIPGRFDQSEWKQSQRHGREKLCRVNISAEQLVKCGIDPNGPAPEYRIWASDGRPRLVISLRPPDQP